MCWGGGDSLVQRNVLGYICVERWWWWLWGGGGFIGTMECAWVHMCVERCVGGGVHWYSGMYLATHVCRKVGGGGGSRFIGTVECTWVHK